MSEQMQPGSGLGAAVPEGVTPEVWADNLFNSAVAEKVMGWRAHDGGLWFTLDGQRRCYTYEWDPKHLIGHAWQAVEKAGVSTITIDLEAENNSGCVECWLRMNGELGHRHTLGSTVPHAISLALLAEPEE